MYKNLRIAFTVISALCIAAAFPLGYIVGFVGAIGAAIVAGIFFFLMLICKQSQESAEAKQGKLSSSPNQETEEVQPPAEDTEINDEKTSDASAKDGNANTVRAPYKYKRKKK